MNGKQMGGKALQVLWKKESQKPYAGWSFGLPKLTLDKSDHGYQKLLGTVKLA
jgi:hypothetical protein